MPSSEIMSSAREGGTYLTAQIAAFYPVNAAEFRDLYGSNPFPAFRREGLASMTDDEVVRLAEALQYTVTHHPGELEAVWGAVIEQGRRAAQGGN